MKSSHNRIIRGADVEGILFCNPKGNLDKKNPQNEDEQSTLKALENFCYQKGLKNGKEQAAEECFEKGQQEGYQKGLKEGREKGLEEGIERGKQAKEEEIQENWREKFEVSLKNLQLAEHTFLEEKQEFFKHIKKELEDLLIAICQKMLMKEIADPETFTQIIANLLQKAKSMAHGEHVQVLFSPEDLTLLEEHLQKIHCDKHNITQLDFLSDSSITKGCCRIQSPSGILNFDVERELKELNENFLH